MGSQTWYADLRWIPFDGLLVGNRLLSSRLIGHYKSLHSINLSRVPACTYCGGWEGQRERLILLHNAVQVWTLYLIIDANIGRVGVCLLKRLLMGLKDILHVISAEDEAQRGPWVGRKLADENSHCGSSRVIRRVMSGRDTMTEIKERKTCGCSLKGILYMGSSWLIPSAWNSFKLESRDFGSHIEASRKLWTLKIFEDRQVCGMKLQQLSSPSLEKRRPRRLCKRQRSERCQKDTNMNGTPG